MKNRVGPGKPGLIPTSFHCQKQGRKHAQRSMKSPVSAVSQAHLVITSKQSLRACVCQDSVLSLPINCTWEYTQALMTAVTLEHSSSCSLYIGSNHIFPGLLRPQSSLGFNFTLCAACSASATSNQESIQHLMEASRWFTQL